MNKKIYIYILLLSTYIFYNYYNFINSKIDNKNNFFIKLFFNLFFININNIINYDNFKILLILLLEYVTIYKNIFLFNYNIITINNYLYFCWLLLLISSFKKIHSIENIVKVIILIIIFYLNCKIIKYIYLLNYILTIKKIIYKRSVVKVILFILDNVVNMELLLEIYLNSLFNEYNNKYIDFIADNFKDIVTDLIGDYSLTIYDYYLYNFQYNYYLIKNFILPTLGFIIILCYRFYQEFFL